MEEELGIKPWEERKEFFGIALNFDNKKVE